MEEANQRGTYLSEDEIDLRAARRAAVLLRNY
jgi:hypothetical protein